MNVMPKKLEGMDTWQGFKFVKCWATEYEMFHMGLKGQSPQVKNPCFFYLLLVIICKDQILSNVVLKAPKTSLENRDPVPWSCWEDF